MNDVSRSGCREALLLGLLAFGHLSLQAQPTTGAQARESVLDGIVRIEHRLITRIPETPRWEEQLDLTVRRVRVGDAELYVEDEGSGIPIVLLHGGPGATHHGFHPWFSRARDFARVIYYDQRGCGLSGHEPGELGYSVDQAVQDLDSLRVALGIDAWVLVGFSYGGFLAQYYTTQHPHHVAGLVLVGASPGIWTNLGRSHQYDYIAQEEHQRMGEIRSQLSQMREDEGWSEQKYMRLLVYNNFLNGDWKRQLFYRPAAEDIAQIALYEWVHDEGFNSVMSQSMANVDLTGAFDSNPIPTLLLEGKWDLTWGDGKPTILSRNHPNARMLVVEDAGHSIYNENPQVFFSELEEFIENLNPASTEDLQRFTESLSDWHARWTGSLEYRVRTTGSGVAGSRELANAYRRNLLDEVSRTASIMRIGFALYDTERYEEALYVFSVLESAAEGDDQGFVHPSLALIWQGHMLDLLGRREEALTRYQRVLDLGYDDWMRHDQYVLRIDYLPHAAQRLETPFQRVENTWP